MYCVKKTHFKMHISSFTSVSEGAGAEGESNQKAVREPGGCSGSHLAAGSNDESKDYT